MNNEKKFDKNRVEEEKRGFVIHRMVYFCVITLLAFINLTFSPEFIWFVFPLIGWGLGLTIHYINIRNLV
ncbi:2TM domain-containing protein [Metallumcola ferriviriculae]|uniref:2TM domain-containing protein n=1 Tax=Metallumcola ferriviriculae TaxID=3039180 RepID=A0AAU0UK80_9FIRM|nr:2TM domain-containing protein [Desulfitibacteraceae bacterium MK1]